MVRDKIKQASIEALKNSRPAEVGVLRYLISIIDKKELQLPPGGLTEAEEISVLRKELKNKEEAREMFLKASRDDLVKEQDYEIEVLKRYLPAEIDESEIASVVSAVIAEKGNNFGLVMGETMKRLGGRAGGEAVAKIVKQNLA